MPRPIRHPRIEQHWFRTRCVTTMGSFDVLTVPHPATTVVPSLSTPPTNRGHCRTSQILLPPTFCGRRAYHFSAPEPHSLTHKLARMQAYHDNPFESNDHQRSGSVSFEDSFHEDRTFVRRRPELFIQISTNFSSLAPLSHCGPADRRHPSPPVVQRGMVPLSVAPRLCPIQDIQAVASKAYP